MVIPINFDDGTALCVHSAFSGAAPRRLPEPELVQGFGKLCNVKKTSFATGTSGLRPN